VAVCAGIGDVVERGPGEGQSGEYQQGLHAGKREKALIVKKTVVDRWWAAGWVVQAGTLAATLSPFDQPISEHRLPQSLITEKLLHGLPTSEPLVGSYISIKR
jgi:hypothetical protein